MQDLAIVHMLQTEADLSEPVHDLCFREVASSLVCDHLSKITTVSIVHYDAQVTLLRLVELAESDDVRMIQYFENLCLLECLFFFALTHVRDVDLLDHTKITVALALDKVRFTKRALSKQLLLLVYLKEGLLCRSLLCWLICAFA